jgi:hypothetical protein
MALTKKQMLETYAALMSERDLLRRYFWDSRMKLRPEACVTLPWYEFKIRFSVYSTKSASGGYIVTDEVQHGKVTMSNVEYWEEYRARVNALPFDGTETTNLMKPAVEKLRGMLARAEETVQS